MSKTKKAVRRAADLKARFARIKAAVQVTDELIENYFDRRIDEIETFNGELQTLTTEEGVDEQPVN